MNIAIYAGSFDPFTNGHLSIVKEASELFDKVIILFAINGNKTPAFPRFKMAEAVAEMLVSHSLDNVHVACSNDLTADVCRQ